MPFSSRHLSYKVLPALVVLLAVVCVATAFFGGGFGGFGGDCCCGDCCCDCCCGGFCAAPALLAIPCGCCDSFGLYGGSIFGGRRRRKRQEIEAKREELYADNGPRSTDFLNNHKCAEPIWLTLLARKWAMENGENEAAGPTKPEGQNSGNNGNTDGNSANEKAAPLSPPTPHSSKIIKEGPHTQRFNRR